jgi:hypothetical protein
MANDTKTLPQLETELNNEKIKHNSVKTALKQTITLLTQALELDVDSDQDDFDEYHDKINKHLGELRRKRHL